jgi:prepilin-type N-terminal cleavage/methylation domain-containing protein
MPTSGTGIFRGRVRIDAGFSLLELLVVVAIIGLMVQAVTLSMGALGHDREIGMAGSRAPVAPR